MARNKHTPRSERGIRKNKRKEAIVDFLKEVRDLKREFDKDLKR